MLLLLLACRSDPASTERPPPPGGPGPRPHGPPPAPEPFFAEVDFQLEGELAEHPLNILLISLDTVRADSLALYGGQAEVPNLEALAARGRRFDQAVSHFPQTCLSHWSMLSGVLPELHGNTPGNRGSLYRGPTMAELALRSGYATAAFIGGQTLMDSQCGLSRGFQRYDDDFVIDPRDMKRPGQEVSARASAWIQEQQGPWFAFVHYFDAHFPYTPAENRYDPDYSGPVTGDDAVLRPYRDGQKTPSERDVAHVRALYEAEISELDALLAPVIAAAGEQTLVVVTSDHGESFEHDYWFNHKDSLQDGVLHVPLVLAGPGVEPGVHGDQVGLIDLAPTLLELAGLPHDARMQGSARLDRPRVHAITDPWDPASSPQYAERSASTLRVESTTGARCFALPGEAPSPCGESHRATYDSAIASLKAHQAEAPAAQGMDPEECARLEALGYTSCAPGPPPGGGRPPPPPR